jgi:acetyl-CoA acetyltransferase
MNTLKNKSTITGVGETLYFKSTEKNALELVLEASAAAINDAGLASKDIDGIIPYSSQGVTAEGIATNFGIEDLRYSALTPLGGASPVAALAVTTGVANNVLVCLGRSNAMGNEGKITSRLAEMPQMNVVAEFEMPIGANAPAQFYAPMARRHMEIYGTKSEHFAEIAMVCRANAQLNERAIMRKPMKIDDYLNSRMIADPLRLFDCSLESFGAAAVIVSSSERAHDMRHAPIYIGGVAEGHPDSPSAITQRSSMTTLGISKAAPIAFKTAGIELSDIDVAQIYDCFTYIVLCQLEDLGFCKKGEGGDFVSSGAISRSGRLPINTHGGLLSEAHMAGMNHINELVRQLRGHCGERQIKDAEVGLVTGFGDLGDGSIAILHR